MRSFFHYAFNNGLFHMFLIIELPKAGEVEYYDLTK